MDDLMKLAGTFYNEMTTKQGGSVEKFEIIKHLSTQELFIRVYISGSPYSIEIIHKDLSVKEFEEEFNLNVSNLLLMP
jgi:hypothetical protein